jgi:hypothetical protein
VLVGAPRRLVRRPRVAQVVHERAPQSVRGLLEVVVRMRTEPGLVAPPSSPLENIDHQVGRAEHAHLEALGSGLG